MTQQRFEPEQVNLAVQFAEELKLSCVAQNIKLNANGRLHRQLIYYVAAIAVLMGENLGVKASRIGVFQIPDCPPQYIATFGKIQHILYDPALGLFQENQHLENEQYRIAVKLGQDALWLTWITQTQWVLMYACALGMLLLSAYYHSIAMAALLLWVGSKLYTRLRRVQQSQKI